MIKSIQIDNAHSIDLDGSMGWIFVYRAQFGRDILPDLMPMLEALLSLAGKAVDPNGEITAKSLMESLDADDIDNAFITLSGMETMTLLNIIWALAKNRNKSIASPEEWFREFDSFPLDEIVPEALKLVLESCVSTKNSKRLLKWMGK